MNGSQRTPGLATNPYTNLSETDRTQITWAHSNRPEKTEDWLEASSSIPVSRSAKAPASTGLSLFFRVPEVASLAGKRVRVSADHRGGTTTAKVATDGSFSARLPKPSTG